MILLFVVIVLLCFLYRHYVSVFHASDILLQHCRLAKKFESLVRKDNRFIVIGKVTLGLVCFRLQVRQSFVLPPM